MEVGMLWYDDSSKTSKEIIKEAETDIEIAKKDKEREQQFKDKMIIALSAIDEAVAEKEKEFSNKEKVFRESLGVLLAKTGGDNTCTESDIRDAYRANGIEEPIPPPLEMVAS